MSKSELDALPAAIRSRLDAVATWKRVSSGLSASAIWDAWLRRDTSGLYEEIGIFAQRDPRLGSH
jgi:hypothetical protein